jgi:4-hydroxy-4-methyl-2-oxoglutarate aldolase
VESAIAKYYSSLSAEEADENARWGEFAPGEFPSEARRMPSRQRIPLCGEIWFVQLPGDPPGKERRPVVIVSLDARSRHERAGAFRRSSMSPQSGHRAVLTDMDNIVSRLHRLDSCAVSDALDKLGLPAAVSGIHRFSTDRRIAGRVLTVKLDRAEGRAATTRHLCTAAIEAAMPGEVIVVEQRTGIDAASWGGNLSIGAKQRGVAGVVIDGPARDIDESRQLDFPVFAKDHTARTARGRIVEVSTNETITVGGVAVSPGDYVVADASAVAFVAAREIDRVLDAAEAIVAREKAMAEALLAGKPISQVMGANYEHMLRK